MKLNDIPAMPQVATKNTTMLKQQIENSFFLNHTNYYGSYKCGQKIRTVLFVLDYSYMILLDLNI
jgi:hypothetical protein